MADLIAFITGFFDQIGLFFTETLPQFFIDAVSLISTKLFVLWFDLKVEAAQFAWSIASEILSSFNLSSLISSYISQLSPTIAYVASRIGLFDGLNLVMQAGLTGYVLRFVNA